MQRRLPTISVLALSTFACVIEPGVLEGGADDDVGEGDTTANLDGSSDDSTGDADTSDSGGVELGECLVGTNPEGGVEPGAFPIASCGMICDEGWGHAAPMLPIAWTLDFTELDPQSAPVPVNVLPLASGDGVVVVSRNEFGTELLRVSGEGDVLGVGTLSISAQLWNAAGHDGVIYLGYFDELANKGLVMALDENANPLWSYGTDKTIDVIAAAPEGGVVFADLDTRTLTRLDANGSEIWTAPSLPASSLAFGPSGQILAAGYLELPDQGALRLHASTGETLDEQAIAVMSNELLGLVFLDDDRVLATGTLMTGPSGDAQARVIDLAGTDLGWSHHYNRGLTSCTGDAQAGWDWFGRPVRLPDGTVVINGASQGPELVGVLGNQPTVFRIDDQGEVLGRDVGLWFGATTAVTADVSGSAYAVMTLDVCGQGDCPSAGFYLRKY